VRDDFNYWDVDNNVPNDMTAPLQAVKHGCAFVEMNERGRFSLKGRSIFLGRRGRTATMPLISTEVAVIHQEQDYQGIVTMGLAAQQRRQAGAEPSPIPLRSDPERGEEYRRGKGVSQILD
jgi:hypothetical protein